MVQLIVADLQEMNKYGELAGRMFHPNEIPNEVYHGYGSPGVSRTGLALCLLCPQEYKEKYLDPQDEKSEDQRKALIIGSASHTIVLEPERFHKEYKSDDEILSIVYSEKPDTKSPRNTKLYKETRAAIIENNPELTILKSKDYNDVHKLIDIVKTNELASSMLTGGKAEYTLYWNDPETGVLCKDRIDLIRDDLKNPKTVEFKTIGNIYKFKAHCGDHDYDMQAVIHYNAVLNVMKIKAPTVFIVRQKESRVIRFAQLTERFLDIGYRKWRKALSIYAECTKTGEWPGFPQEIESVDPETWYEKQMLEV
jgi:hypothetical protein